MLNIIFQKKYFLQSISSFTNKRMLKIILSVLLVPIYVFSQQAVESPADQQIMAKELKMEQSFTEAMKWFITENYNKATEQFKTNIKLYGNSPAAWYMLSKSEKALNQNDNAIISAKNATDFDKANVYYKIHLAQLLVETKQYKDAISEFKKIVKLQPENVKAFLSLAEVQLIDNEPKEALKTLSQLEKNVGIREEITFKKQEILVNENKVDKALKEGSKITKNDPEYNLQQARVLVGSGRFQEAESLLLKSINDSPNFTEAYNFLADIYQKTNNQNAAFDLFQKTLAQSNLPFSVKSNSYVSWLATRKNLTDENSINQNLELLKALELQHPNEARVFILKGDQNVKLRNNKQGRDAYLQAVKLDKGIFEAWLAIIELDVKLNDHTALAQHADRALQFYPNHAYFWYHHGFALKQNKEYDEALVSLEEASRLSNNNPALQNHIKISTAEIYHQKGDLAKAEKLYVESEKNDAENEQMLYSYSLFLAETKKNTEKAIQMATLLVKKYPNQASNFDALAWVQYFAGDLKSANENIDKALKMNSQPNSQLLEHKGDILFKSGNKSEAIGYWQKAFEKNPSNKKLENKIKEGTL